MHARATTGEPAGAGVCSVPGNQTTEIASIGVRVPFRRRGIAGALTTRLVQEAFNAGVTVAFLMAAHEEEARIYTRAGFSATGEILHLSAPAQVAPSLGGAACVAIPQAIRSLRSAEISKT